jgi:hypothetical protein
MNKLANILEHEFLTSLSDPVLPGLQRQFPVMRHVNDSFLRGVSIMKSKAKRVAIAVLLLTLLSAVVSTTAWGMDIDVAAGADYSDSKNPCLLHDDGHCWITGYLLTKALDWDYGSSVLSQALGNWNSGKPIADQWTLAKGGALPGILKVTEFDTFDEDKANAALLGGVEIKASYQTALTGDPLAGATWYWAQAITLNYRPGAGAPDTYITTMDDAKFNTYGTNVVKQPLAVPSPLYPYQTNEFYDEPADFDTLGHTITFQAQNFLVTANTNTDTLTVYQGFGYGWSFTCVPEPASVLLLGIGAVSLLACKWRRRKAKA